MPHISNTVKKNKAVFFDRDGTLIKSVMRNGKLSAIRSIEELNVIPDARKILLKIKNLGYKLVLVTNQPDVSSGEISKFFVDLVNDFLKVHLNLDLVKVVYDNEINEPERYKPAPGMLLEASDELNINLTKSFMVGDRWRDIGAGKNANCKTILFKSQNIEKINLSPDFEVSELSEILDIIN